MRTSKNVRACLGEGKISSPWYAFGKRVSLFLSSLMDTMQISRWSKDTIEEKREVEESKEMSKAAGKVKAWIRYVFCVISPEHFCKQWWNRNSFIFQQVAMDFTLDVFMPTSVISSIFCRANTMFGPTHTRDTGYFILLHAQDLGEGGGQWGMLGSISLKLHWFAVGVTGAQVMVGSTQLEMNPCSLMRRRDKRVANYSVLLCTENNLVLLRPSMINLLQLWLCLFFTLEDFKGGC